MIERESKRKPYGVRKRIRNDKAEIRRYFAPTGDQIDQTRILAVKRLTELDMGVLKYISNGDQGTVELRTHAHDAETSKKLGQVLAQKINQDVSDNNAPALGKVALHFIEREWIESALGLIKQHELSTVLNTFLDVCDDKVQKYLEAREQNHDLTRLQEVKNRVINPITGVLAVK